MSWTGRAWEVVRLSFLQQPVAFNALNAAFPQPNDLLGGQNLGEGRVNERGFWL
jgi:hypothetical protein